MGSTRYGYHPPLEGGSKNSERSEEFFGEGYEYSDGTPPRNLLTQISTLPQGEGRSSHSTVTLFARLRG